MGFLAGKRALIVGVATERSIAWGIAQAMHREGAELAFTYLNDKMKERVAPLANAARNPNSLFAIRYSLYPAPSRSTQ